MQHPLVVHVRARYDVYVGRGRCPKTGVQGQWGNPFRIGPDGGRHAVLVKYVKWLRGQPHLMERAKRELAGKVLGCWCAPAECHGDVLARVANGEVL